MMDENRLDLLRKVRDGSLSIEEAAEQLEPKAAEAPPEPSVEHTPPQEDPAPDLGCWTHAWLAPVLVGTVFLALSAWLMNWAFANDRVFWFSCAWVPLILSVLVVLMGVWSRMARWIHLRVHTNDGTHVVFSLPVPFRLAGWVLKIAARWIPEYEAKKLDILPQVFEALSNSRDGITVEVNEKDGSQVRVYVR